MVAGATRHGVGRKSPRRARGAPAARPTALPFFFFLCARARLQGPPPPPLPGRLVAPPASWRGRLTYLPRFRGPRLVRASSPPWYRVDEILPTEVGPVPCGRDHRHRGMTTCCTVQCGQETVVPAPPTRWCPGGGSHLYKRARPRGGWAGGVQGGGVGDGRGQATGGLGERPPPRRARAHAHERRGRDAIIAS